MFLTSKMAKTEKKNVSERIPVWKMEMDSTQTMVKFYLMVYVLDGVLGVDERINDLQQVCREGI